MGTSEDHDTDWLQLLASVFSHLPPGCYAALLSTCTELHRLVREQTAHINLGRKTAKDQVEVDIELLVTSSWPRLTSLNLSNVYMTDPLLQKITQAPSIQLTQISLANNWLGCSGVKLLADAHWSGLEVLDLSHNGLQQQGLSLVTHHRWPLLKRLYLRDPIA